MQNLSIECSSFRVVPLSEGRVRLELENAERPAGSVYTTATLAARLHELLGKPVSRACITYWRKNMGFPHTQISPKKFLYHEADVMRWLQGRRGIALP
jgi:hypothetical protein